MFKPRIFISYSHQDESWKDLLWKHLYVPARQDLLEVWADGNIPAGVYWHDQVIKSIDSSQLAILLISTDFLGSAFILDVEIPRILARHRAGHLKVLPVLVRPCYWESVAWLAELQMRPWNAVSLSARRGARLDTELALIVEEAMELMRDPAQEVSSAAC